MQPKSMKSSVLWFKNIRLVIKETLPATLELISFQLNSKPCPCKVEHEVHTINLAGCETVDLIQTTIVGVVHDVVNTVIPWSQWACLFPSWAVECWASLNGIVLNKVVVNAQAFGRKWLFDVEKDMEKTQPMPSFMSSGNAWSIMR
jgi:hypothetical protein